MAFFYLSCHWAASPRLLEEVIQATMDSLIQRRTHPASQGQGLGGTIEPSETQDPVRGMLPVRWI
jgi:hypothetical protein